MDFKARSFISTTLALSFIIISLSGAVLYIMPHGRVAYWINWKIAGLSKDAWEAVHTIMGYVFMVAAGVHFYLNWRLFVSYIKNKLRKGFPLRKELTASLLLTLIVIVGTIGEIPPFSSVMDIGGSIKLAWEKNIEKAPVPHAELMTLETLIENFGLSTEKVLNNLENYGIKAVNIDETLKSLAHKNNMSPAELYHIIQPHGGAGYRLGQGLGQGLEKGLGLGGGRGRRNR